MRGHGTGEFFFSEKRDLPADKRFIRKALKRDGRPDRIVIDGSRRTGRQSLPAMARAGFETNRNGY